MGISFSITLLKNSLTSQRRKKKKKRKKPLALAMKTRSSSLICHPQVLNRWSPGTPSYCLKMSVSVYVAWLVNFGGIDEPLCLGFSLLWPESCQVSSPNLPEKCGGHAGLGVPLLGPSQPPDSLVAEWPGQLTQVVCPCILGKRNIRVKGEGEGRLDRNFSRPFCLGIKSLLGNGSDGFKCYR